MGHGDLETLGHLVASLGLKMFTKWLIHAQFFFHLLIFQFTVPRETYEISQGAWL